MPPAADHRATRKRACRLVIPSFRLSVALRSQIEPLRVEDLPQQVKVGFAGGRDGPEDLATRQRPPDAGLYVIHRNTRVERRERHLSGRPVRFEDPLVGNHLHRSRARESQLAAGPAAGALTRARPEIHTPGKPPAVELGDDQRALRVDRDLRGPAGPRQAYGGP